MWRILTPIFSLPVLFALCSSAFAINWDQELDHCNNSGVLKQITQRFDHQIQNVPHLPDVKIVNIYRVHQQRLTMPRHEGQIKRRYCSAKVALSNGRRHKLFYLIESNMGFASMGDGVSFCIAGFDRWHVYNRWCKSIR